MKKTLIFINIFLLPFFAFCQIFSAPIKLNKSLRKVIEQANKKDEKLLPYGIKNLLLNYDETWKIYNTKNIQTDKNPKKIQFDSLVSQLDFFIYNDFEDSTRVKEKLSYENNLILFFPHFTSFVKKNNKTSYIQISCSKLLSELNFNTYSFIFSGIEACINCEYAVKQTQHVIINVNKKNEIIDKLLIGNIEGNDLGLYRQYFYIDENKIIHLKSFSSDELEDGFLNYEQFKILPNGNFMRYYPTNGFVKNNTEQGSVVNNKRNGKWVEQKQLKQIDLKKLKDNCTWLEAIYKDGIPIGEWKYYELLQKFDKKGHVLLSSRKKGKLLYVENYLNGILKKKRYIK